MTLRPLEEIERDAAAATPGPWQQYGEGVMRPGEKGYLCDAFAAPGSMEGLITFDLADARFIAKARTDVPALVARVRDLEGAYGTKMAAALVEMLRRSGVAEGELVMAVSSACARIAALEAQVATLTAERDAAREAFARLQLAAVGLVDAMNKRGDACPTCRLPSCECPDDGDDEDAAESFDVTDPDEDAPDGAVVDGYERIGDQWVRRAR